LVLYSIFLLAKIPESGGRHVTHDKPRFTRKKSPTMARCTQSPRPHASMLCQTLKLQLINRILFYVVLKEAKGLKAGAPGNMLSFRVPRYPPYLTSSSSKLLCRERHRKISPAPPEKCNRPPEKCNRPFLKDSRSSRKSSIAGCM
jgi:hypothetical protein